MQLSTCRNAEQWAAHMIDRVSAAAQPDDAIRKFAEEALAGETQPGQKARQLADRLGKVFNFVNSAKTTHAWSCRPAGTVFAANYGNALESAALLLGMLRAADLDANPQVAVKTDFESPSGLR